MNLPSPGSDQRVHTRKALRVTAELIAPGAPPFAVRTMDVSAGGLGVIASVNPPMGLHFVVRLRMPLRSSAGTTAIEVAAQVTHSVFMTAEGGFKVGLRFLDPPASTLAAIAAYLKG